MAALLIEGLALERGRGEGRHLFGVQRGKKPSWPVSAFLKLYYCFTASSQMGQELTATLQSICQLHKVPALWCIFKARQRMLPVGQSHFPHKDSVEKTGFTRDRVHATLS